eukprot:SAG25_NODE_55_length_18625_cov_548.233726_10_plen_62_part_00
MVVVGVLPSSFTVFTTTALLRGGMYSERLLRCSARAQRHAAHERQMAALAAVKVPASVGSR